MSDKNSISDSTKVKKEENQFKPESKKPPKSYLKYLYPNGNCPDSELIEYIESEIVDAYEPVKFDDIAGLEEAKKTLEESVLLRFKDPTLFKKINKPFKGVLLYGWPGTGKTMLATSLAKKDEITFFNCNLSSEKLKSKENCEKIIKIIFEMAKYYSPSIIFLDEIYQLSIMRGEPFSEDHKMRRMKAEVLVNMDELFSSKQDNKMKENEKLVSVLCATNHPWDIDEAILRRFEKRIYIKLPNEKEREQLFRIKTKGIEID